MRFFCFFLFCLLASVSGANPEVCKFKGGKPAALSLTFDDATREHLTIVAPVLEKYGFHGSFYVIVTEADRAKGGNSEYLNWDELRILLKKGHEIGSHSMTHYRLTLAKSPKDVEYEISAPLPVFRKQLGRDVETFCYPGLAWNGEIEKTVLKYYLGAFRKRYICGGNFFSFERWKSFLAETLKNERADGLMFHDITKGCSPLLKGVPQFDECIKYLKSREADFWVDTCANVLKYTAARDHAVVNRLPGSPVSDSEFDGELCVVGAKPFPLTVRFGSLFPIAVRQNEKEVPVTRVGKINYFDLNPGKFFIRGKK